MSPEFLRRYYVLRIISTPKVYGIDYDGYVPLGQLQRALETKRNEFSDTAFYDKLLSNSQKTIKRDINAIEAYYDVEIKQKRNYGYYIKSYEQTINLRELFDKTELFLLNQKSHEWKHHISTEDSSLNNTIEINNLVNAIENKLSVHIVFDGWYDDNRFQQYEGYIQPLHIKESNRAWYLIAHNAKLGIFSFPLDRRIKYLKISSRKVELPILFDVNEYYKNSIGILKDHVIPQRVILKITNHHLKYLITKPMHHSQQVLIYPSVDETESIDTNNEDIWGTIEIFIQPNYEFFMEILKFNKWVKILSPQNVVDEMVVYLDHIRGYY